jgi:hypothetical protein
VCVVGSTGCWQGAAAVQELWRSCAFRSQQGSAFLQWVRLCLFGCTQRGLVVRRHTQDQPESMAGAFVVRVLEGIRHHATVASCASSCCVVCLQPRGQGTVAFCRPCACWEVPGTETALVTSAHHNVLLLKHCIRQAASLCTSCKVKPYRCSMSPGVACCVAWLFSLKCLLYGVPALHSANDAGRRRVVTHFIFLSTNRITDGGVGDVCHAGRAVAAVVICMCC